ncbi:DUF4190 domain-containing protein [Microtetraspora malaysiensis]|uniref:DUF4190 domain-containing protein n=1 Tax=Microtetraspora malaysiensis TaxID=161358 RepID=UPI003D8E66D0
MSESPPGPPPASGVPHPPTPGSGPPYPSAPGAAPPPGAPGHGYGPGPYGPPPYAGAPYGPGAYPPGGYPPGGAPSAKTNGLAVASLVFGILGGVPIAVTLGVIALVQIKKRGEQGRGFAVAGLAVSGVWVVIVALIMALGLMTSVKRDDSGEITGRGFMNVAELREGDCLNGIADGKVSYTVTATPCSEPHDAEVITQFVLSVDAWPGTDAAGDKATSECEDRLGRILADSPKLDRLASFSLYPPDASSWKRDPSVKCLVVDVNGGKLTEKAGPGGSGT